MRIVALRFFTVYGPRQRPDLAIHTFTRRIWNGQPIDQFGDGTTRRDYTYIDDVIQGVMTSLGYDGPLFDIFNLGESETIQLKDLITAIENALGRKAKINQLPEQPGDVPLTCADISKARRLLGYKPTTPLRIGLPRFISGFIRRDGVTENARPTIFVAAVCCRRLSHLIPARRDFDQNQSPVCAIGSWSRLIGDWFWRFDPFALRQMTDAMLLWNGGAASAAWHLL